MTNEQNKSWLILSLTLIFGTFVFADTASSSNNFWDDPYEPEGEYCQEQGVEEGYACLMADGVQGECRGGVCAPEEVDPALELPDDEPVDCVGAFDGDPCRDGGSTTEWGKCEGGTCLSEEEYEMQDDSDSDSETNDSDSDSETNDSDSDSETNDSDPEDPIAASENCPEEGTEGGFFFYEGPLVPCGVHDPCGGPTMVPCTLCHLIILVKNIYDLLLSLLIIAAILLLTVGGVLYIVSSGNSRLKGIAKEILTKTLTGFALFLLSWLIVYTLLVFLSANPDGNSMLGKGENWYTFTCNTKSKF